MKRIFIGGLGRSGTTITLNAFYQHGGVFALPVETKYLVEEDGFSALTSAMTNEFSVAGVQTALIRFETLMRRQVTGLEPSKFSQQHALPTFLLNNYDHALEEFLTFVKSSCYFQDREPLLAATRRFVAETFDTAASAHGYTAWAEKTPTNIWRIPFLRSLWPDCYFIHCLRDPREILLSLMEKNWLPGNLTSSLGIFKDITDALIQVRRTHSASVRWLEVRLEDMVADTSGALDRIAEFADLDAFDISTKATLAQQIRHYYEAKPEPSVVMSQPDKDMTDNALRSINVELGYPFKWPR